MTIIRVDLQIYLTYSSSVNEEEFHEKFYEIERELDLQSKEIQGIKFWDAVKTTAYDQITSQKSIRDDNSSNEVSYTRRFLLALKNIVRKNPFLGRSAQYLFFTSGRREREGEEYIDKIADPVIDLLEGKSILFERAFSPGEKHFKPAYTRNVRYVDFIEFGSMPLRYLQKAGLEDEEKKLLESIEGKLYEEFECEIDLTNLVKTRITRRKALVPIYKILLKLYRPKAVFIWPYTRFEVVEAASKLEIPTIELQHGFIHQNHPDYAGYKKNNSDYIADYLFSWGDYWVKENVFRTDVETVGFPYLERKKKELGDGESEAILFISQWAYGEKLSKFAAKVSDEMDQNVLYKVHPNLSSDWEEKYPWLEESEVEVLEGIGLYEAFQRSSCQVGINSTALFEGIAFGLPTMLFEEEGLDSTLNIENGEGIQRIKNVGQVMEFLESKKSVSIDSSRFFEENPTSQIKSKLDEVV